MALVSLQDYEKKAAELLTENDYEFFRSGAGDELTMSLNRSCFDRLRIRPRVLRNVANRDFSLELFGQKIPFPIGVSPTALQKMAEPQGENTSAKAAGKCGVPFVLSTTATSSIEEVGKSAPDTFKWFQTYIFNDRKKTEELVHRAEKSGFKAFVISVDAPVFGLRRSLLKIDFKLPDHLSFATFDNGNGDSKNNFKDFHDIETNTWEDLKWLTNFTKLPVIVKGILTGEDAELAINAGASGIVVSNHGARQLDSVPATIEALPEVVKAVAGRIPVFLDGGIRQGTDVFKALALGATMVFIGRSVVYGLAVNGQQGVEDVINMLKNEFDIAACLAGCRTLKDISQSMVVHESYYAKL